MIDSTFERAHDTLNTAQDRLETARGAFHATERIASGAAGASLLIAGIRRGGFTGAFMSIAGADLVYHGVRGEGHLHQLLRRSSGADQESLAFGRDVSVSESIEVTKPAAELYSIWRDFENLPVFMPHVREVRKIDETHSQWTVDTDLGPAVQWTAEVITDRENELIGWRTTERGTVAHAGSVCFQAVEDDPAQTRVTVNLQFNAIVGRAGAKLARFCGADPSAQIRDDLRRFKQFAESLDLNALTELLQTKRAPGSGEENRG